MQRKPALAIAALLAFAAAPVLIHSGYAAPEPPAAPPGRVSPAQTFKPSCRADALADTRPDPAWVGASYEHDNCVAPLLPRPPDGARASREKIVAAMAHMKTYGQASDRFQRCIVTYLKDRGAQARRNGKPLPGWLTVLENHRILVAQKNKERGEALMRSSIEAFNAWGSECADHG